jgi:hypothetical protein
LKAPQQSLKNWGDQKWRTKSGKPSSKTGERYLPEAAIKSLSPAEYAATTRAKRAGKKAGKQFVAQPKGGLQRKQQDLDNGKNGYTIKKPGAMRSLSKEGKPISPKQPKPPARSACEPKLKMK